MLYTETELQIEISASFVLLHIYSYIKKLSDEGLIIINVAEKA
jgi:hypothetical protein